jgi:mRNA-degrading endonuclease RelE of RelBE toxin-antitoxin system
LTTLLRTDRFRKDFRRLPREIQGRLDKVLTLLLTNPRHPSLRVKKMEGAPGIWELRVTDNYRITFEFAEDAVILRRIGTHNVLRQP